MKIDLKRLKKDPLSKFLIKLIFTIIIGIFIYSPIHEFIHYFFIKSFGYSAKICWGCIPTMNILLTPINQITYSHYFIISISPYILATILLFVFLICLLISKKEIFFFLSIIPAFDVLSSALIIPLSLIIVLPGDFSNLLLLGFNKWVVYPFIIIPLLLFIIILKNYIKLKKFSKQNK